MNKTMTPKDKLIKAIFGKTNPTPEEVAEVEARFHAKRMKEMSDEEFRKEYGMTRESYKESQDKMLDNIHWVNCIIKYERENNISHKTDVVRMVRHFYLTGKRHEKDGLGFDFNGNEVNLSECWEAKKNG